MGTTDNTVHRCTASFRDPSGFVFSYQDAIYRQINECYRTTYESLKTSGLYSTLTKQKLLVPHEEVSAGAVPITDNGCCILKPFQVPYISYPYEWSFSQLKDAALLTLRIQLVALEHGFVLKDASAYNVQFIDTKAVFIDTLSFDVYQKGLPWAAYKQFCQHFLAPLALMVYSDVELSKLLITHIDGIPLPLASKLLPTRTRLRYSLLAHVHLHAKLQQRYAGNTASGAVSQTRVSRDGLVAMTRGLINAVTKLDWKLPKTEWGSYYQDTNYSDAAEQQKKALVDQFLDAIPDSLVTIQDLGANAGVFSRVAARHCKLVISQDVDPVAVELNYRQAKAQPPRNILPLVQNLFSPSPAIGWGNAERDSFTERSTCSATLVLALIHHLAISNNVPLTSIAQLFARLSRWLIIEFIPKSDSQVQRLLATREDIFPTYTEQGFVEAFENFFSIEKKEPIAESQRTLYLLRRSDR